MRYEIWNKRHDAQYKIHMHILYMALSRLFRNRKGSTKWSLVALTWSLVALTGFGFGFGFRVVVGGSFWFWCLGGRW
jgi:hypothetical protein